LCYICGKCAIYGSYLHIDGNNSQGIKKYFIISDGENSYTTGREVRRIHVLSDMRVMAFVESSLILSKKNHKLLLDAEYNLTYIMGDMITQGYSNKKFKKLV